MRTYAEVTLQLVRENLQLDKRRTICPLKGYLPQTTLLSLAPFAKVRDHIVTERVFSLS
jgi:hypothetical protein